MSVYFISCPWSLQFGFCVRREKERGLRKAACSFNMQREKVG
jgi:hypothetical protein